MYLFSVCLSVCLSVYVYTCHSGYMSQCMWDYPWRKRALRYTQILVTTKGGSSVYYTKCSDLY